MQSLLVIYCSHRNNQMVFGNSVAEWIDQLWIGKTNTRVNTEKITSQNLNDSRQQKNRLHQAHWRSSHRAPRFHSKRRWRLYIRCRQTVDMATTGCLCTERGAIIQQLLITWILKWQKHLRRWAQCWMLPTHRQQARSKCNRANPSVDLSAL